MGRKIPGKKHHGIRDPLKQQQILQNKTKDQVNNPPENNKKASFKLAQFMSLKNNCKAKKPIKLKRNVGIEDRPETVTEKVTPIKQLPHENDVEYLKRVNRITSTSLMEAQYEMKYHVKVTRDSKDGSVSIQKLPKNNLGNLAGKRKGKQRFSSATKHEIVKEFLRKEKKEKNETLVQDIRRDVFKFGEFIHEPPIITTLPKKAKSDGTVPRPGKRNLLLKQAFMSEDNNR